MVRGRGGASWLGGPGGATQETDRRAGCRTVPAGAEEAGSPAAGVKARGSRILRDGHAYAVVQMSDFAGAGDRGERSERREEAWDEDQCPALVACRHMTCSKTFRDQAPEPVRFGTSSFFGSRYVRPELAGAEGPTGGVDAEPASRSRGPSRTPSPSGCSIGCTPDDVPENQLCAGLITTYAGYSVSYLHLCRSMRGWS